MRLCTGAPIRAPKPGGRLMKKPHFGIDSLPGPIPCKVEFVNEPHGFYVARFAAGYRESFRIVEGANYERA